MLQIVIARRPSHSPMHGNRGGSRPSWCPEVSCKGISAWTYGHERCRQACVLTYPPINPARRISIRGCAEWECAFAEWEGCAGAPLRLPAVLMLSRSPTAAAPPSNDLACPYPCTRPLHHTARHSADAATASEPLPGPGLWAQTASTSAALPAISVGE